MASTADLPGVKGVLNDGQLRPQFIPQQPKVTVFAVTNSPDIAVGDPLLIESGADIELTKDRYAQDGVTPDPAGPIRKPSEMTRAVEELKNGGSANIEVIRLPDPTALGLALELNPTNKRRFDSLEQMVELAKDTPLDNIVWPNATIDASGLGVGENFGYQMANLCHRSTENERSMRGFLGTVGPVSKNATRKPTLQEQEDFVTALEAFNTTTQGGADFTIWDGFTDVGGDGVPDNYAGWATTDENIPSGAPPRFAGTVEIDDKGFPVDLGKYITVIVDRVRFFNAFASEVNPTLRYYDDSAVNAYAGLRSALPARLGTTNRVLPGTLPLRPFSPTQVARLQEKRFVACRLRPTGFVVNNGLTFAYHINQFYKSDFTQETTMLIAQQALSFARLRAEQFIGQPNNAQVQAALESDIDDAMKVMQRNGTINRYNFQIIINPAQAVLGRMRIELTIVPAFEITRITISTSLARE